MKIRIASVAIVVFCLFSSAMVYSQAKGPRKEQRKFMAGLELSSEQQKQITDIRSANQADFVEWKSQMRVLKAELQALQVKDKVSQSAINGKINQITGLQGRMMKQKAATHQKIRSLLKPEQRAAFDKHFIEKGARGMGCKEGLCGKRGRGRRGYGRNR
ncbi:MAG: Spy/CpxP family protein refolding chaperone [Cytophagales bacterium]|nr:Spy/CpxP family protein refolding chaperone [Cytophagales bacterium]